MKYLISGYYGEGNAGDEAILAGILQEIGRRDEGAEFRVLSFDPDDTRRRHAVEALPTTLRDPRTLGMAVAWADLVISGGGSMLHEADFALYGRHFLFRAGKLRPIPYFLAIVGVARTMGKPVMWYAQGLGPLHTKTARLAVRVLGSASQVVAWRDREAAALAADVGVRSGVQMVVPDPAYALAPCSRERAREVLARGAVPGDRPLIAVCPRPWLDRLGYRKQLVEALARVADGLGHYIVFLPFQERTDGPLCRELAANPRLAGRSFDAHNVDDPSLLAGLLREADVAVTMRLHSGILAAAAGTPAAAIAYDPKVSSFARQTGQGEYVVTADELETEAGGRRLESLLRESVTHNALRRRRLERAVAPLREAAGRTAQLAVDLARAGRL
ncbi:MAG: colanic acid biosynthesis protein [Actinobacteria bacterium ADurb.Bin444]|nr:MAG: colanic acid biosynthesis protein [Actinobacteria bacterium ADurb.Bin444]